MDAFLEQYQSLKRLKLAGHKKAYSIALLELLDDVQKKLHDEGEAYDDLNKFLEKVKYAGTEMSDSELKQYEKRLEKNLSMDS